MASYPTLIHSGLANLDTANRISSNVPPRSEPGSVFLSAAVGKCKNQIPLLPELVRGEEEGGIYPSFMLLHDRQAGQLSHVHISGTHSPASCQQGWLYHAAQASHRTCSLDWDSFSALMSSGIALPPATGSEKCGAQLQQATAAICDERWGQIYQDLILITGFSVLNLLSCPDKVTRLQGPLTPVLETVKEKFSSLACNKWQRQAGRASQAHHHSVDEGSTYLEAI